MGEKERLMMWFVSLSFSLSVSLSFSLLLSKSKLCTEGGNKRDCDITHAERVTPPGIPARPLVTPISFKREKRRERESLFCCFVAFFEFWK